MTLTGLERKELEVHDPGLPAEAKKPRWTQIEDIDETPIVTTPRYTPQPAPPTKNTDKPTPERFSDRSWDGPALWPYIPVVAGLSLAVMVLIGIFLVDAQRTFVVCNGSSETLNHTQLRQLENPSFDHGTYVVNARLGYNGDWTDDVHGKWAVQASGQGC